MAKTCVVLLADTDTHEAMGRMANALTSAKEFIEEGDGAVVIFDGAGRSGCPSWSPLLRSPGDRNSCTSLLGRTERVPPDERAESPLD